MAEYIELLQTELAGQFLNPKKRLFWGYLCSAFFLALCWLCFFERQRLKNAIKIIASPAIWLSKSSKADMICFVINRVFFYFFRPILITQIIIATALYQALHYQTFLPLGIFSHSPYWLSAGLFTCCFFLLDDLSRFALHLALHKIPILWEFHKFHHSAETLTPLTVTRAHPVEGILFTLRSAMIQGITIAIFLYLFGQKISLLTVLGVNIFVVLFHGLGSNLRHSHISIYYPKWLERFLMSPAQHHLHHSSHIQHFDKNFGVALSLWDRLTGSFLHSTNANLNYGIGEETKYFTKSVAHMYLLPFFRLVEMLDCWVKQKSVYVRHLWASSDSVTKEN